MPFYHSRLYARLLPILYRETEEESRDRGQALYTLSAGEYTTYLVVRTRGYITVAVSMQVRFLGRETHICVLCYGIFMTI